MTEPNREAVEPPRNEIDRKTAIAFIDIVRRQDKDGLPYFQSDWLVDLYVGALDRDRAALLHPAPQSSPSDEERAHQFMGYNFGDDELGSAEHAELVRTLTLFSAAVRAEATLAANAAQDAEIAKWAESMRMLAEARVADRADVAVWKERAAQASELLDLRTEAKGREIAELALLLREVTAHAFPVACDCDDCTMSDGLRARIDAALEMSGEVK